MRVNDPTTVMGGGGGTGAAASPGRDAAVGESITGKRSEPDEDSPDGDGDGDQGDEHRQKRSRGRPRLDTKDETAADVSRSDTSTL